MRWFFITEAFFVVIIVRIVVVLIERAEKVLSKVVENSEKKKHIMFERSMAYFVSVFCKEYTIPNFSILSIPLDVSLAGPEII